MTKQEIIEYNKLIADFMNVDLFVKDALNTDGNSFLNYNTSWNALIPVIEKIHGLFKKSGDEKMYLHLLIWQPELILTRLTDLNINKIYKAVIEFINWYNTQTESK